MATPPAASAPAPPAAAPPAPPARSGDLADRGGTVRELVRARSWRIEGPARATKGVDVELLELRGDLAVAGTITADRVDTDGRLSASGAATGTAAWRLLGETRLGGALSVGSLFTKGRLDVRGDLKSVGAVQAEGSLDVLGALSAASLALDGAISATGDVTAPEISLVIRGPSKVANLRGRRIVVHRPAPFWESEPAGLDVLEIEADEVRLAGVTAQYVRADRVTVGPGCQLTRVDGSIVAQSPRSHVGPQSKSPRPKGLSR